jgi:hypothetical protein
MVVAPLIAAEMALPCECQKEVLPLFFYPGTESMVLDGRWVCKNGDSIDDYDS